MSKNMVVVKDEIKATCKGSTFNLNVCWWAGNCRRRLSYYHLNLPQAPQASGRCIRQWFAAQDAGKHLHLKAVFFGTWTSLFPLVLHLLKNLLQFQTLFFGRVLVKIKHLHAALKENHQIPPAVSMITILRLWVQWMSTISLFVHHLAIIRHALIHRHFSLDHLTLRYTLLLERFSDMETPSWMILRRMSLLKSELNSRITLSPLETNGSLPHSCFVCRWVWNLLMHSYL